MITFLNGLMMVQGYVAAEAYAQGGGSSFTPSSAVPPSASPSPTSPPTQEGPVPFLHFQAEAFVVPSIFRGPYRETPSFDFAFSRLPQKVVLDLFETARNTGCRASVFLQHSKDDEPETYEIRLGTPESMDINTLGGEVFDHLEEQFFGTEFVAHIHPPGQPSAPSFKDLSLISERARQNPGRTVRHVVFGFSDDHPVATVLTSTYP